MGISDDIKPRKVYNYSHNVSKAPVKKVSFELEKKHNVTQTETVKKDDNELDKFMSVSDELYPNKDALENDFFNGAETKPDHKTTKKNNIRKFVRATLWIFVIILIILALYKNIDKLETLILGENRNTTETTPSDEIYTNETDTSGSSATGSVATAETVTNPTTDTTASTAPVLAKKDIKIEILNGNGIAGSADKVRDLLINDGFLISKVANAKKFTYTSTYIYYRSGAEASMELVKAALSTRTCITQKSDPITTGYDIVIVVGKK